MYLAGVDEAGRGPVIGPLVIAGVVINKDDLDKLVEQGLADSKLLTKEQRNEFFDKILACAVDYKVVVIPAEEIDYKRNNATNLNRIEINIMIDLLGSLKDWSEAYVDACDRNAKRLELTLRNNVRKEITAEHFADLNYPIVSAASVIAKVIRDKEIKKLHEAFGVDFGSGYPHDPKTNQFLTEYYSEHQELPIIARKTWATSKRVIELSEQKNLDDFFRNAE
ncbi:MAG TPA: ribonuclease HII [Candidatus Glassbacteria bacterium]|nr:ribonuclease HII [Candidatus Glassbacteria bacterium]